jgi:ribosomal protein L15
MFLTNKLEKTVLQKSKRVGRGGNRGKNAGNGNKGQIKRAGKTRVGFEGGQKSLIRRTPKYKGYSFSGKEKRDLKVISLTTIEVNFEDKDVVTLQKLKDKGIIDTKIKRVRVINIGTLTKKVQIDTSIYMTNGVKKIVSKGV